MERNLIYEIETDGFSIKEYLKAKSYTKANINQLKEDRQGVYLNDKPAYMYEPTKKGDILKIHIRSEEISEGIEAVKLDFKVVYEDEDIIVVDKPADMPIHPSSGNRNNTLGNALMYYFKDENFVYRCINRLDRDTTGLTIVAKHSLSASILYQAMYERRIHRTYLAIVKDKHNTLPDEGRIDLPIARKEGSCILREVNKDGDPAITHYEVIRRCGNYKLLRLQLDTGRTHQIRVHMSHIGHPLLGDYLYKPDYEKDVIDRTALHSFSLAFTHPITGQEMYLETEMPQDMGRILE